MGPARSLRACPSPVPHLSVLVLLGLVNLALPRAALGAAVATTCQVRFVIDSASSSFVLGGQNSLVPASGAQLNAPISQNAGQTTAWQGALYATFHAPNGTCPTTLPALAAALQTTTLYSNGTQYPYQSPMGPYQGIALLPAQINGLTAGETYNPQNLVANVTTSSITVDPVTGAIAMSGPSSLIQGYLWTVNIITGNRYDTLAPGNSTWSASGVLSIQNNVVTMNLTKFRFPVLGVGVLVLGGTSYQSITNMSFTGNMVLTADLSCKSYCGDFGRCAEVNGTVGCQCECGWEADKTGACNVPSGFCPLWGAVDQTPIYVGSEPSAPPSPPATAGLAPDEYDDGYANVYRPVIAFVPVMIQILAVLLLTGAMLLGWPWVRTDRGRAADGQRRRGEGGAGPVAESLEEGLHDAAAAGNGNGREQGPVSGASSGGGSPSGDGEVVLALPVAAEARGLQQAGQGVASGPILRFDTVSVWIAPSFHAAVDARLRPSRDRAASGHKRILLDVSGHASGGRLLGLMVRETGVGTVMRAQGPSGSGKSTLLNVLCGQVQAGGRWHVEGALTFDGRPASARQLSRMCAHVPQHDLLLPGLTVEECLRYAAAVRLDDAAAPAPAAARVDEILRELHIAHIRSAYGAVTGGASTSAISGGERQRVSLGMELVADARLLLLDEPTSGLDAFNALSLVRMLARVARGGGGGGGNSDGGEGGANGGNGPPRIVVASLHQPSPTLFEILDDVLLLAEGRVVFSGAPSHASSAFSRLGLPCPPSMNIGEHMLMAVGDPALVGDLLERLDSDLGARRASLGSGKLAAAAEGDTGAALWSAQQQQQQQQQQQPSVSVVAQHPTVAAQDSDLVAAGRMESSGWVSALVRKPGVLFWRTLVRMQRHPSLLLLHLAGGVAMGIIVGFVFFKAETYTTDGVIGRLGIIFFTVNVLAFPSLSAIDTILEERQVVERELTRGYYSPASYMISKLVVDGLLLRTLPALFYSVPFYWLMGLRPTASAFTIFLGVTASFTSLIGAMVMFLTNLLGEPGRILVATTMLLLIFALFSGFLANMQVMTWALRWICYVSPFHWAWEALVINEIRPLELDLSVAGLPGLTNYPGELFLTTLGIDPTALTLNIVVVVVEYAGCCLLAVLSLYLRIFLKTRGWIM